MLNAKSRAILVNALHVAAEAYKKDEGDARLAGNSRLAQQFAKQHSEAVLLADQIEDDEPSPNEISMGQELGLSRDQIERDDPADRSEYRLRIMEQGGYE